MQSNKLYACAFSKLSDLANQYNSCGCKLTGQASAQRAQGAKTVDSSEKTTAPNDKQAAIAAAIERAKAQKAAENTEPKNTTHLSNTTKAEIAAINAN